MLLFALAMSLWPIIGQTSRNYSLKGGFIYGSALKHTKHLESLVKGPVTGGEFDIEWQTLHEKNWYQYMGFPEIGLGVVGLDLGNPEMLGQLFAAYPYLNIKLLDLKFMRVNMKGGAGISFLTKTFNNTATDLYDLNTGNAAIGSHLNVYFSGGGNLELPLCRNWTAVAGFDWNHASNGSFYQPNSGLNMLNASLTLKYYFGKGERFIPQKRQIENIPQNFTFEIVASGGARELYYKDDKMYPTGSLVFAAYRQTGNLFRLGLGVDAFYDGVYNGKTQFKRTYLTTDELKNKIRIGISFQPEMVFGRFSAGIHFGLYLYNPLKNIEPYTDASEGVLNKPLIYAYNIEEEDGWFYTRAALKYSFSKHIFASIGLKTHLQKAEFIEWGLGYRF